MGRIIMTSEMFKEYNAKQSRLSEQYRNILNNLEKARAEGDISDNAGYESAVREREQVGKLLTEVMDIIDSAEVLEGNLDTSCCNMFTYVTLEDLHGKRFVIQLVASNQGKPPIDGGVGRVSVDSTCGKMLKGKKVGDTISYLDGNLIQVRYRVVAINDKEPQIILKS